MYKFIIFTFLLLISNLSVTAQKKSIKQTRLFQFSLVPGLGSNGIHPGGYMNNFSLNLTSGYSAATYGIEVAGISNLNTDYTKGIQIAGIFNLTGGNAFASMNAKQIDEKIKDGFEANLEGLQMSGLANVVINNVFGSQISGGVNYTKGALFGLQVSGIGNVVGKYGFAVQLAGGYNSTLKSLDGVQASALFNYVGSRLQGIQIGGYNHSKVIEGRNSFNYSGYTGVQIGIINSATKMNGLQIGLINFGGQMQGTQFGLINFYKGGHDANTKDGTSFGLINIGSTVEVLAYSDELFFTNYQVTTGTLKNGRKIGASKWVYIQNGLIFGYNPDFFREDNTRWVVGYSLNKKIFNRSSNLVTNRNRFISGGIELLHYNQGSELNSKLNLLSRFKSSIGTRLRIHPKINNIYLFAGLSYNLLLSRTPIDVNAGLFNESHSSANLIRQRWLGGQIGLMMH